MEKMSIKKSILLKNGQNGLTEEKSVQLVLTREKKRMMTSLIYGMDLIFQKNKRMNSILKTLIQLSIISKNLGVMEMKNLFNIS